MNGDYHNVEGRSQPNENVVDAASETIPKFDAVHRQQFESRASQETHQITGRGRLYLDPHFAVCQVQGAALGQGPPVHHLDYIVLNRSA